MVDLLGKPVHRCGGEGRGLLRRLPVDPSEPLIRQPAMKGVSLHGSSGEQ
jgi:hypothetical protein